MIGWEKETPKGTKNRTEFEGRCKRTIKWLDEKKQKQKRSQMGQNLNIEVEVLAKDSHLKIIDTCYTFAF